MYNLFDLSIKFCICKSILYVYVSVPISIILCNDFVYIHMYVYINHIVLHRIMCFNAFTACFCCPCMIIYWLFANLYGFIVSVLRCVWYIVTCGHDTTSDESIDNPNGTSHNPLMKSMC
jgi:hypothetical protein